MEKFKQISKYLLPRIFIGLVLAFLYAPILILMVFSFDTSSRVIKLGSNYSFGFDLYGKLFSSEQIMEAVFNSLIVALVAALISTIVGTVACVGIMSLKKRNRSILMTVNQIPVINAEIVTGFSLMLLFVAAGLSNNGYLTLICAHILICLPFVVLNVLPRFRQLNPNLFEAAQDLGANPLQALVKVIIPQLLPGMLSGFLLGFTLSLDDFVITQFNRGTLNTISTLVYSATKRGVPPEYRALSTLLFLAVATVLIAINIKADKNKKGESK